MSNRDKLKQLVMDVFMLSEAEFSFDLKREDIKSWDSMGIVSLAVGVQDTFGCRVRPEQAAALASVSDIVKVLAENGIAVDA